MRQEIGLFIRTYLVPECDICEADAASDRDDYVTMP
jgi:hypothetical protein